MWERLEQEAEEPGTLLKLFDGPESKENAENCRDECDKTLNCRSSVYCAGDKLCYLYDGEINENTPQKENYGCFTSYHSCSGNF